MAAPAWGERSDWVGPAACGSCHQAAYQAWRQSAHARAGERLGESPTGRCLACHTSGEAPAGRPFFGAVTCEACHGPGAGYAVDDIMRDPTLARALGLRDLSTVEARDALCRGCHRAELSLAPFDPARAYQRIEHQ
ncbi:multiheme c-type cytochrome [Haliangium sp.]|uniref:multiheme c-type cytochrome n=1 Tax=Haliangium sp. TaxID=2663208 RepID=UPI003D12D847